MSRIVLAIHWAAFVALPLLACGVLVAGVVSVARAA